MEPNKAEEIREKFKNLIDATYKEMTGLPDPKKPWLKFRSYDYMMGYTTFSRYAKAYGLLIDFDVSVKKYAVYTVKLTTRKSDIAFHAILANIYYDTELKKISFLALGPSYASADGEYRSGFVIYNTFLSLFDIPELKAILEELQEIVQENINENTYVLLSQHTKKDKNLEKLIEKDDLITKILTCTTLYASDISRLKISPNNLSEGYINALKDEKIIEILNRAVSTGDYGLYKYIAMTFVKYYYTEKRIGIHQQFNGETGIKTIPLTKYALENIGDLTINVWRELYISKVVSNLFFNFITPGVPIFGTWNIVDGYHPDLFNNQVQKLKYEYSDIAKKTIGEIQAAKSMLYEWDDEEKQEIYLSMKLQSLGEHVNVPINFARYELMFSEKALIFVNEYVGFTLADLPISVTYPDRYRSIGPVFKNPEAFDKYMFDLIYTLYALNYHFDIIHTDLHLNNACFVEYQGLVTDPETGAAYKKYVVYNVHGKLYKFIMNNRYATIIDFSRALMGKKLIENQMRTTQEKIYSDQVARIKQGYAENFPEFYAQYNKQIDLLLLENYEKLYDIFKAIDIFKVGRNISYMLSQMLIAPDHPNINKQMISMHCVPLVEKIQNIGYNYIVNYTSALIKGLTPTIKNPNFVVIDELFSAYVLPDDYAPPALPTLTHYDFELFDYFLIDGKVKYTSDYEKLPDIMKPENFKNHGFEAPIPQGHADYLKWLETHDVEKYKELIKEEARADYDKELEKYRKHSIKFNKKQLYDKSQHYYDS